MKKGQTIGKYAVVAELAKRAPAIFAAHASAIGADAELVILEVVVVSEAPADANDAFVKRARRLAQVRHPNICRIRDVVVTKDKIAIASDFIEGETLAELLALDAASATKRFGLPEQLRVLVDVLSGMSAIHLAPDLVGGPKDQTAPFHGAIHPKNIVVGADGSTRLVRIVRPPAASDDEGKSIEEATYAAPEFLLGDTTAGARVDVYSVGVLLWEALSGAPLFSEDDAKDVVARQLAGALPRATPPAGMEWANALVEIAARALEVDPDKRFASTAELAGALRLAVQARLAPASRIGAAVTALAKEKIAERRKRLQPAPRATAKIFPPKTAPVIANPAKIAALKRNLGLPTLASEKDDIEPPPETKRFRMESLDEEDLQVGDDEASDARSTKALPAKKASMAPPLPTRAISVPPPPQPTPIAVPPMMVAAPPPIEDRAMPIAIAPPVPPLSTPQPTSNPIVQAASRAGFPSAAISGPASNQNLETVATVIAPFVETPAISAATTQQSDASGAVVLAPQDPQRRKRVALVIGMVAFAAVILLVAGIRRATSTSGDVVTTAASAKNSATTPAHDPVPTATAVATATTTVATTTTPIADAVQADDTTPQKIDPPPPTTSRPATAHDWSQHTTASPKPTHKKPPRSSYEPEGI